MFFEGCPTGGGLRGDPHRELPGGLHPRQLRPAAAIRGKRVCRAEAAAVVREGASVDAEVFFLFFHVFSFVVCYFVVVGVLGFLYIRIYVWFGCVWCFVIFVGVPHGFWACV